MNILFIINFVVGFIVSEIPRVSVFGHCPYSLTFPYRYTQMWTYLDFDHFKIQLMISINSKVKIYLLILIIKSIIFANKFLIFLNYNYFI